MTTGHATEVAGGGGAPAKEFGLFIPAYVKSCPGLTPYDWVVAAQVIQYSKPTRPCFASMPRLARETAVERRSVQRIVSRLCGRGLLVRTPEGLAAAPPESAVWTAAEPDDTGTNGGNGVGNAGGGSGRRRTRPAGPESPAARPARTDSPLARKLVEICGFRPVLGTSGFPTARFERCLAVLEELNAEPRELDTFVTWWNEEAISFRRTVPTLGHVAGHFHLSRQADWTDLCEPDAGEEDERGGGDGTGLAGADGADRMNAPGWFEDEDGLRPRDPRFHRMMLCQNYEEAFVAGDRAEAQRIRNRFESLYPDFMEQLEGAAERARGAQ